jgi:hypothetical protein
MQRLAALLACAVALGVLAHGAAAYLTGSATVAATASATTLQPGPTPTAMVRGRAVTLSWTATAFADGRPVPGYAVVRYAVGAPGAAVAAATGCAGTVAATTCTETGVPPGAWRYAVVPRAGGAWRGPEGPPSDVAVVTPASATATPTLLGASSRALVVAVAGFDPDESLSLRLDDPASGASLTAAPVTADADGAASVAVMVPPAADGPHLIHVVGATGTVASAPFTSDASAPTTVDSTAAIGGGWMAQPQTAVLTADDGPNGSGVAATHWTSDGTEPTPLSPQGGAVPLTADGIHVLRYFSIDAAGNREAVRTAATAIRIDRTPPTPGALATPGATAVAGGTAIRSGQTLTATASDPVVNGAASGIAQVAYYACPGTCTPSPGTPGTFLIGTATGGTAAYPVTWAAQPADGAYSLLARATDGAGTSADSAVQRRIVDNAAPVVSAALADATANQAGHISRKSTFRAYANAVDAGVGIDAGSVIADLSAQCGTSCTSVALSSTGGPFTVLTAAGPVAYAYRSALLTASPGAGGAFSVRAADLLGAVGTMSGAVQIDTANSIAAPATVTLASGATATGHGSCAVTPNGYINARQAGATTVSVVTAATASANAVVVLTATSGPTSLTFAQVVPQAGTRTVAFEALDLRSLGDGSVTLSAVALTPGGNAISGQRTQTVLKLTSAPTAMVGALTYTDNASPVPDRAASTLPVGPAGGFLAFTQTAGTRVGAVYGSAALSGSGALAAMDLADERSNPTYAVSAVDAACNAGAAADWTPTATR